jgi:HK97 family phage major capsid protein
MEEPELRAAQIKLNEERLRAWEEGKRLLADTGGQFTAEQRAEWERINTAINELDAKREVFTAAERREAEAAKLREANVRHFGAPTVEHAEKREADQFRNWLRTGHGANGTDHEGRTGFLIDLTPAQRYNELRHQGYGPDEARALAWDTGSIASGVPTTTAASLYETLTAGIAGFRMPTTKITTAAGEQMKLPRVNAHGIGTQVSGQGTTLAGTDPTFLSLTLDAYKYGQLVKVSNEVLTDTGFDISGFVVRNIGRALAQNIDVDLVVGTGSGEPQGMMTGITGSGTVATGGSLVDPTYEKLVDLVYSVNDSYRSSGNAAWLMRDLTASVIRKLRDGAGGTVGAVLWDPSLTAGIQGGQPDRLLGFPVYTDPNVASLASNAVVIAFGDWSGYYLRTVGSVAIERDASRYFDTDEVGFRGKWRVDGDYQDTTAVNIMKRSV